MLRLPPPVRKRNPYQSQSDVTSNIILVGNRICLKQRHAAIVIEAPDLLPSFRERLRISPTEVSVAGSLPVLFFGDALSAQVATIGLNPSKFEYLDAAGRALSGRRERFATTTSLGADSRTALSDSQANRAIETMRSYYDDGRPVYGSYFRHLRNFLGGMGMSFADRSATHLDLVQESTDPFGAA